MQTHFYSLNRRGVSTVSLRPVAVAVILGLCVFPAAASPAVWFNPRFFSDDPAAVADLSRFGEKRYRPEPIGLTLFSMAR